MHQQPFSLNRRNSFDTQGEVYHGLLVFFIGNCRFVAALVWVVQKELFDKLPRVHNDDFRARRLHCLQVLWKTARYRQPIAISRWLVAHKDGHQISRTQLLLDYNQCHSGSTWEPP